MADDEVQCGFALDNGGYLTRVSFSGDSSPRGVFPTVVGRLRNQVIGEEMGNPDFCKYIMHYEPSNGFSRQAQICFQI